MMQSARDDQQKIRVLNDTEAVDIVSRHLAKINATVAAENPEIVLNNS
ncbi:MAG: hypothetical protein AAGD25_28600 [Cyanobacteria bacterium P01_F01_bin.150]